MKLSRVRLSACLSVRPIILLPHTAAAAMRAMRDGILMCARKPT